jgi:integrase
MKKYPEQNIDVKILSSVELKVSKHDIKSHGILKDIEVKALLDYCDNISYKPAMQRLFFETMFITALRHDACLNLTTDQIKHIEDPDSKQMVYVIKQTDKSKARDIAISDSLTERLLKSKNIISEEELLKDTRYDFASNRIFTLSEKAITKTLKQFCKSTNISEDRNISLHSIRNATCNYALKQTNGNITETAKYMGHSSIKTTFDFYTDQSVSYTNQLSITLHDNSISTDELSDLTKEELLDLISKAGNGIVKQLIDLKKGLKK